ncbi:hypothetical protein BT96DRAFT_751820, partial [Gymnopus androsaceus JB14]
KVLLFDLFGTVDWQNSIIKALKDFGKQYSLEVSVEEWQGFADEWRTGYWEKMERIAQNGGGPNNVVHREILDQILSSSKWSHVGKVLNEEARAHLNLTWRRMSGFPNPIPGLYALKKKFIITALSNMNVRLLWSFSSSLAPTVGMVLSYSPQAKHANLPWDAVFSSSLFNLYKPCLSLAETSHKAAMIASHAWDLRIAAKVGLK